MAFAFFRKRNSLLITALCCLILISYFIYHENPDIDQDRIKSYNKAVAPIRSGNQYNKIRYISTTFDLPGIGNLLFQYASLIGIAKQNSLVPIMTNSCVLHEMFDLPVQRSSQIRPGTNWGKVVEHRSSMFDPHVAEVKGSSDIELIGYLQSWMYFQSAIRDLRKHLKFNAHYKKVVENFQKEVLKKHLSTKPAVFIGIHVRRGNLLQETFAKYGYRVATKEYIEQAIAHYEGKFSMNRHIVFVVASDDQEWSHKNIKSNSSQIVFTPDKNDKEDFAILSNCEHSIMTVGTFGWWSSWLAGGQVVYYKNAIRKMSRLESSFSKSRNDYFYPGWAGIA